MPWSAVKAWLRDYGVSYGVGLDSPDEVARAQGACAVLVFGGTRLSAVERR